MVRELDFSDTFESSAAPTTGFVQSTGLQVYASTAAFVTAKGLAAAEGDAFHNSTTDQINYYDGSAWREVVSAAGAQTIAGVKTFSDSIVVTGDLTVNGTTTTLNTATLDVEDPQINVNKSGNQATANASKAGFKVEMSDATHAILGYDSSLASKFKAGESGSEIEVVTVSHTQTLTNKTIDGDNNTVQDLALTALKTNLTDASRFIVRDASGIPISSTKAVPSGVVVGTTDTQALTGKDIDGGTASNTNRVTIPKDTTSNINSLTRKQGTILFDTTTNTPKFDDGSNLQSFSSSGLIPTSVKTGAYSAVNGDLVLSNASGGTFSVTLPTATSGHSIAVKKINADTSFNAITVVGTIDGVSNTTINTFGETIYLVANGTEWKLTDRRVPSVWTTYTPTGAWTTNTTYEGRWKRVGDSVEIFVRVTLAGAPNTASLTVNLPANMPALDTTKIISLSNDAVPLGSCIVYDNSPATSMNEAYVSMSGPAGIVRIKTHAIGSSSGYTELDQANPITFATTDEVNLHYIMPITGWNG